MADLQWRVGYDPASNKLMISLMGRKNPAAARAGVAEIRDLLGTAAVSVDAPEILLDKEVERVKAVLLERHRTVTALVAKHNGKPVDTANPS